jgi:signal peptidase I
VAESDRDSRKRGARGEAHGGSPEEPVESNPIGAILDQVVTLVVAIAIALAIRHFLVEPFRIPSGSMFPTLLIGDHLFVNKLAYGPRIPFTDLRLPGLREPERGDVVVFEVARPLNRNGQRIIAPVDRAPEGAPREDFVKRLVGLPGDKITLDRGRVWINGEELPLQAHVGDFEDDSGHVLSVGYEDLGDCRHAVLDDPSVDRLDRGTFVVEPGRYFMMGDNRDNSNDSRAWGSVRLAELKGPAFILYWSWDVNGNMLSFFNPLNWLRAEKRWGRVFQRVQCDPVEVKAADR